MEVTNLKENCNILIRAARFRFPKHSPFVFLLYMLVQYNNIRKWKRIYKVIPIPSKIIARFLESHCESFWDDANNTVIINNKYLNDYKGKGGFVRLIKDNKILRIAYALGADLRDDVIYLSDHLYFNLSQSEALKLKPIAFRNLKFISEVNLSLSSSNYELSKELIDTLLKNYFKSPKIVYKNDLLALNLKKYAPESYYTNNKLVGLDVVHFKCNRTHSDTSIACSLCVMGETTLKQSADTQNFLASILKTGNRFDFQNCDDFDMCALSLCPFGLEEYFNQIERAIKPFLKKGKFPLKPAFLIQGNRGCGKSEIVSSLASKMGLNLYRITSLELTGTVYAQTETKIRNMIMKAKLSTPCLLHITNFENFGKNAEGEHDERIMSFFRTELSSLFANNTFPLILICTSNTKSVPLELCRIFLETFEMTAPDEAQRSRLVSWILQLQNLSVESEEILKRIAGKTHGFVFEDLKALVLYARKHSSNHLDLHEDDFEKALDVMQAKYNQSLGAPKVPKVEWSDIGGLGDVKHEIIRTINLPLKHPELFKSTGLRRSGILLYGPPGTGKTLIAKAVATECNLCFLSVKGPELLNMYVGQSEQNIRDVFERAREASPCIIFFDELDSLAPNRGMSGDSGGVMDRIVSQLLAEMDGLGQSATIFVIGATNRPDLIDPALLRPGRFDKLLYVGPCVDFDSKLGVLRALTRRFKLAEDICLEEVVRRCPKNITGADFYGLCSAAWMSAVRRIIQQIERSPPLCLPETDLINRPQLSGNEPSAQDVIVNNQDFLDSLNDLKPSIKTEDLAYFDNLKRELDGNTNRNKDILSN